MNTETKHTPGPWRVIQNRHPLDFTIAGSLPGANYCLQVAQVQGLKASKENAALIARAPDLLAENERLRAELTSIVRLLQRNRIRYTSGRMMPEIEQQIYIDEATAALNPALKP